MSSDTLDTIAYVQSLLSSHELRTGESLYDCVDILPLPLPPQYCSTEPLDRTAQIAIVVLCDCLETGAQCLLERKVSKNAGVVRVVAVLADFLGCEYLLALCLRILQAHSLPFQEAWLAVMLDEVRVEHTMWAGSNEVVTRMVTRGVGGQKQTIHSRATPKGWCFTRPKYHVNGMLRLPHHTFAAIDLSAARDSIDLQRRMTSLLPFDIWRLLPHGREVALFGCVVCVRASDVDFASNMDDRTVQVGCLGLWNSTDFCEFLRRLLAVDNTSNAMFVDHQSVHLHGVVGHAHYSVRVLRTAYRNPIDLLLDATADCDRVAYDGYRLHFLPCTKHAFLQGVNIERPPFDSESHGAQGLQLWTHCRNGFAACTLSPLGENGAPDEVTACCPSWGSATTVSEIGVTEVQRPTPANSLVVSRQLDDEIDSSSDTELIEAEGMPRDLGLHLKLNVHTVGLLQSNNPTSIFLRMCYAGVFMHTPDFKTLRLTTPDLQHPQTGHRLLTGRIVCAKTNRSFVYFTSFSQAESKRWIRQASSSRFFKAEMGQLAYS